MSMQSDRVAAGFAKLPDDEQRQILSEIERYIRAEPREKQTLQENFSKRAGIDPGPTGSGKCPCCGK